MSIVLRCGEFTAADIRAAQAAGKKVVCVSRIGESTEVRHEFVSFGGEYPNTEPSFYVHSRREPDGYPISTYFGWKDDVLEIGE